RGIMTTVLVQNGTLKRGDTLVVGEHYGRIKAMFDYTGQASKQALPSTPVSVAGLNSIPQAGDQFTTANSEKEARKLIAKREPKPRSGISGGDKVVSLDDFFAQLQEGDAKTLNLIVKADVQGSLEPIVNSLKNLSNDEVTVEIMHAATGNITESDVMLASASNAVILGFNTEPDSVARAAANSEGIEINSYNIIYKLIEDVDKALKGLLDPVYADVVIGRAEVRQVFKIRNVGQIAGCYMRTGEGRRNAKARVIRDTELLYDGDVSSLKHLAENVREVKAGFEFGVNVGSFNNYKAGDIIEFYVSQRVDR
ncbi:MAG: translation initiation factor IF-2, partial [Anaerolineae bacterium]